MIRINIPRDIRPQLMRMARERANHIAMLVMRDLLAETPVDTGFARQGFTMDDSGEVITIQNLVAYILALENGHSAQAPSGYIREIVDRYRNYAGPLPAL